MITLLTIVHVVICVFLVGIVLLQHGKGADVGASFGGSSQSLLGTEGPAPLLNKITTLVAVCFMFTSVTLAYFSANNTGSIMSNVTAVEEEKIVKQEQEPVETLIPMPKESDKDSAEK